MISRALLVVFGIIMMVGGCSSDDSMRLHDTKDTLLHGIRIVVRTADDVTWSEKVVDEPYIDGFYVDDPYADEPYVDEYGMSPEDYQDAWENQQMEDAMNSLIDDSLREDFLPEQDMNGHPVY